MVCRSARRPARQLLLALAGAASLIAVSACSESSDPVAFEAADLVTVTSASATPANRWGAGSAVSAHALPEGGAVVVTTTGVQLVADDDTAEPVEVGTFTGQTQVGFSALSPDGKTLVVRTNNPPALLWYDLAEPAPLATVELGVDLDVREVAFSSGGDILVAATPTGLVSWDTASPADPATVLDDRAIGSLAVAGGNVFAPVIGGAELVVTDGTAVELRTIAAETDSGLLDAEAGPGDGPIAVNVGRGPNQFERTDTVHVVESDSGDTIGTIPFDRPLQPGEWALGTGAVAVANGDALGIYSFDGAPLSEHTPVPSDPIESVTATDLGFATVHRSGAVATWSAPDWTSVALGSSPVAPRFTETRGSTVTVVDLDGAVTIWDVAEGSRFDETRFAVGRVTSVAIGSGGDRVAFATDAGLALVLDDDLRNAERLDVDGRSTRIGTVEFHPRSDLVVIGLEERLGDISFDDSVTLWNGDPLSPLTTIGGESEDVAGCGFYFNDVSFSPDGSILSTVSHDFTIGLHDGATGDYVVTLAPFSTTVLDTEFSATGDLLVAAADDSLIRVWDTEDFELVAEYNGPTGGLQALELLPDDQTMVAVDITGRLLLMDFLTGEVYEVIAELGARTRALAVSSDGGIVAASMSDGTVGLWSLASGTLLTTLDGHSGPVTDIAMGPAGNVVATASTDGTVRTWDLDTTTN